MLDSSFTVKPEVEAHDAAWDLASSPPWGDADPADQLAELAGAVADMVGGIHRAVLAFSGGGARAAVGTAAVSSRVHHIRDELEGVAVAVEALHSGAEDAACAGEQSARMCTDLAAEVERGSAVLARVVEAVEAMGAQRERIERLADQLAEIATFSGVIKEVADKTKLLALNATIEAARAGTHGAAFRVVADEIGKLAADSEAQTRRIATVVAATRADLDPLRQAIDVTRDHGDGVADALEARETVRRIGELAEQLTAPAERVAASAEEQLQALAEMSGHMQGTVVAVTEVDEHATQMSEPGARPVLLRRGRLRPAAPVLDRLVRRPRRRGRPSPRRRDRRHPRAPGRQRSRLARRGARPALRGDHGTAHRLAAPAVRRLARAAHRLRPSEVLDLLRRPHRRGAHGPLRPHARRAPWLVLAAGSDLNVYAPAHARTLCAGWTGDPAKDLIGNRIKRILTDNPALVRANRVGIGGRDLPARTLTRSEYRNAGCDLIEPPGGDQRRLVQTYARDTGAIFTVLSVPVYVHGERWGASVIGWDPDAVAT